MRKVRLIRIPTIHIQPRRIRHIRRNRHDKLHNRELKHHNPPPPVPLQPVLRRPAGLLVRNLQPIEKQLALILVRVDELQHEQEEVAQRKRLHHVAPGDDVEVRGGHDLAHELDRGVDGDEEADAEDLELLVGLGEVRRVPEHEDEDGEDGDCCGDAGDDGAELVEGEVAFADGVRRRWERVSLFTLAGPLESCKNIHGTHFLPTGLPGRIHAS